MKKDDEPFRKLATALPDLQLRTSRREGDRLMLADEVLLTALDGSAHLSADERAALLGSPLTLRRLRALSAQRRRASMPANDAWHGSAGMLRAAASAEQLETLATDDGHWRLHFVEEGDGWRVILVVDGCAPFAARLVREQPILRVLDGGGGVILQDRLDADGECEAAWPFETSPGPHLQQAGAHFSVEHVPGSVQA